MTLVTITGNAWTHQGQSIPADQQPELFFRPDAHAYGTSGLLVGVEVKATLNSTTGAFSVQLESDEGIFYRPYMRWLGSGAGQPPEMWAYRYAEWPFLVVPGGGGPITNLINNFPPGSIVVALGPPVQGATNVVWVDITNQTDEGAQVYAPAGS